MDASHWLFGCDPTQAIVSVTADRHGHARVWRRTTNGSIERSEHRFPNWFLTTGLDLLAHLPITRLSADALRRAHGNLMRHDELVVVELDGAAPETDAYRYLVLTNRLDEVETDLVETANKRDGSEAGSLADLRGLVLIWPPVEQFLLLTGRTYFKGMRFADLRRLQFDLETTGLNDERDRIFMISLRDSSGWTTCLDTRERSEAELIRRFVELVRSRDPDVLENHNIFAFDLPFLVRRAARLGVALRLGRDGSEPRLETDVFDAGDRTEPFLRWRITGREVVDTQHAVRRFGAAAPDLRRHGLKDAARYFGFAKLDREYVPGPEIWSTFQADPERVRRYAADDVEEVDALSRRLLPTIVELAMLLPRPYERIAADASPAVVWEPLLVRAYLHEGAAIPAPVGRLQHPSGPGARAELFCTGVLQHVVQARLDGLLPRVLTARSSRAANDSLGVFPTLLSYLSQVGGTTGGEALVQTSFGYLAGEGLFSDTEAAAHAAADAAGWMHQVLVHLRARGCTIIEVDGEQILFAAPSNWTADQAAELAAEVRPALPTQVELSYSGQYTAMYARAPGSAILLNGDGSVTLIGATFRSGRLESFGERFLRRTAPLVLSGDAVGVRHVFLEAVKQVRRGELPLADLCVQATLRKSPAEYRRSGTREEPYEILLAAGLRNWRVGQRIRYFRGRAGRPQLLRDTETTYAADADAEYYVQRLCNLYAHQFAHAFERDDFLKIFRLPDADGPYEVDNERELRVIKPVVKYLIPQDFDTH